MATCRILNTWGDFRPFWAEAAGLSLPAQVDLWRKRYMAHYPELLRKQVEDYESQSVDWQRVAAEWIFPYLSERLPLMRAAADLLPRICLSTYGRAAEALGLDFDVLFVIYVGIGCGAGWATRYEGYPACLLGLENIAEEGWHTPDRLQGLVAHELGHLAHMAWRREWEEFAAHERDPLFLLYSEGFAVRCEEAILSGMGHLQQDAGLRTWCEAHRTMLAAEFLRRVEAGESVRDFFGSWHAVQGHSQTGYYLGREFVRYLEHGRAIRDVARLPPERIGELAAAFLAVDTRPRMP